MKKSKRPDPRNKSSHGRPRSGGASRPTHARGGAFARGPRPQPTVERPKGRVVAGIHAVRELLKVRPRAVSEFWLRDGFEDHVDLNELHDTAKRHGVRVRHQSPATLDKIVTVHQGVVAFALEGPELSFAKLKDADRATLLVLDEVEDPHNLGAVLRTAWLLGADGVLTPEARAAGLTATVSKVAQGAVEHVPVMQESGLLESLKYLKEQGFWLFGLAADGTKSLYEVQVPEKVIWVLGSESSGIRKAIERECDELVQIPQIDADASYNVSVAAALAMGETFRQRAVSTK